MKSVSRTLTAVRFEAPDGGLERAGLGAMA
jgi:hypothetical protein